MQGWVKIHRKLLDSQYGKNLELIGLFTALLLKANHKKGFTADGTEIQPGQFMTSHVALAKEFKMNRSTLRRKLIMLENAHQIEQRSNRQNTIITVVNWHRYQVDEHQNEQRVNNACTTSEQRVNTNKNDNNNKNNNNVFTGGLIPDDVVQLWNETMPQHGFEYCRGLGAGKHLKNAIESLGWMQDKKSWHELFTSCINAKTLNGDNNKKWRVNLTWLVDYDNAIKVLNGNYKQKQTWLDTWADE